jgi:hypothetical protein
MAEVTQTQGAVVAREVAFSIGPMRVDNVGRQPRSPKTPYRSWQLREKIVKRWLTACTGNLESAVVSMGLRHYGF